MNDRPFTHEQILAMLAAAPSRLAELTDGIQPTQLVTPPAAGEWSARDVLGHLRACSDMWGKAIAVIIRDDHPKFKAVNPRTWIKQTDYLALDFQPSLQAFTMQRAHLLAMLMLIAPEDWSREATVTGAGKSLVRTVYTYAHKLARHEQPHIQQIERAAKRARG
jgi:hypothetical protein